MDGPAPVIQHQVVSATVMIVALTMLVGACSSVDISVDNSDSITVGSPSTASTSLITSKKYTVPPLLTSKISIPAIINPIIAKTFDMNQGIEMFEGEERSLLGLRSDIPVDLPKEAYMKIAFGVGEYAEPPIRPREFVVATNWPRPVRTNIICLLDGVQTSCSEEAYVWRVELDNPGLSIIPIVDGEGRRDVVLLEERDSRPEGVILSSRVRGLDGAEVPYSWLGDPPSEVYNPFDGCGFVILRNNLGGWESNPRPLRTSHYSKPLYMYISTCPDQDDFIIFPFVVLNESTLVQMDGLNPFLAESGETYAWQLPEGLIQAGYTIRVVASLVTKANEGTWATHPVKITESHN